MQPAPLPTARKALDERLIALLMMLLRALLPGQPRLTGTTGLPAPRRPDPLACTLIAPPRRRLRRASPAPRPTHRLAHSRGAAPVRAIAFPAPAVPPRPRAPPRIPEARPPRPSMSSESVIA